MRQIALVALVFSAVSLASYFAFLPSAQASGAFWWILGSTYAVLGALALYRGHRDGVLGAWLRPRVGDPTQGILLAVLLFGAAALFTHWVFPVGSAREVYLMRLYLQFGDPQDLKAHGAVLTVAIFALAVLEEVVWRGLVVTLLSQRMGPRRGWLAAALLYALAQTPTMVSLRVGSSLNPVLPMAALGVGLAWGLAAKIRGKLFFVILSHALFVWCALLLYPLWGR